MKKIVIIFSAAILFTACQNNSNNNTEATSQQTDTAAIAAEDAPIMEFENTSYNFGTVVQGAEVEHEFTFKNTGQTPLIISEASASCGCTVPEYPTHPIKPGESGLLKVIFDSAGKLGVQDRVVTITSNAHPRITELHMIGEVKEK